MAGMIGRLWWPRATFDVFYHDTYFVVAICHVFLFAGLCFGGFAIVSRLFPMVTGRLLGRKLALIHFFSTLASTVVLLTATTLISILNHSWNDDWWMSATLAVVLTILIGTAAQLLFVANIVKSVRKGERVRG